MGYQVDTLYMGTGHQQMSGNPKYKFLVLKENGDFLLSDSHLCVSPNRYEISESTIIGKMRNFRADAYESDIRLVVFNFKTGKTSQEGNFRSPKYYADQFSKLNLKEIYTESLKKDSQAESYCYKFRVTEQKNPAVVSSAQKTYHSALNKLCDKEMEHFSCMTQAWSCKDISFDGVKRGGQVDKDGSCQNCDYYGYTLDLDGTRQENENLDSF